MTTETGRKHLANVLIKIIPKYNLTHKITPYFNFKKNHRILQFFGPYCFLFYVLKIQDLLSSQSLLKKILQ